VAAASFGQKDFHMKKNMAVLDRFVPLVLGFVMAILFSPRIIRLALMLACYQ
jgi:hypothetical protein